MLRELAIPASYGNEGSADNCITSRSIGHRWRVNRTLTIKLRRLRVPRDPFGCLRDCTREYRGGRDLSLDRVRETRKPERFCCAGRHFGRADRRPAKAQGPLYSRRLAFGSLADRSNHDELELRTLAPLRCKLHAESQQ